MLAVAYLAATRAREAKKRGIRDQPQRRRQRADLVEQQRDPTPPRCTGPRADHLPHQYDHLVELAKTPPTPGPQVTHKPGAVSALNGVHTMRCGHRGDPLSSSLDPVLERITRWPSHNITTPRRSAARTPYTISADATWDHHVGTGLQSRRNIRDGDPAGVYRLPRRPGGPSSCWRGQGPCPGFCSQPLHEALDGTKRVTPDGLGVNTLTPGSRHPRHGPAIGGDVQHYPGARNHTAHTASNARSANSSGQVRPVWPVCAGGEARVVPPL